MHVCFHQTNTPLNLLQITEDTDTAESMPYFTFARSNCLTLRLTFSARLQVNVIMPDS